MNEQKIIMRDSDEAAHLETRQVWVDRFGRIFGDDPGAERTARWSGCTHEVCEGCGAVITRGWCTACREKKDLEAWLKAERVPWNKEEPLYSDAFDKYLFNESPEEFAEENEVTIDECRFYTCRPVYGRPIESDYFQDELPEDGELPDSILEAMEVLNKAIRDAGPLSWLPAKTVPDLKGIES